MSLIGKNLRYWRIKRGKSQTDLSFDTRITVTQISRIEKGVSLNAPAERIRKLCQALDITPNDLLREIETSEAPAGDEQPQ